MNRRNFIKGMALTAGAALVNVQGASNLFASEKNSMLYLSPFTLSLSFSPVLFASAAGYFDKNGLSVDVQEGRGAAQSIQLAAAGQVGVGRTGGGNYIVAKSNQSAPVVSIGTIAQSSPFSIISSKDQPVRSVRDLVGKVVGIPSFGGSTESTLNTMLLEEGLGIDDVKKEKVADSAASFGLIQAGRVDAFFANISATNRLKSGGYNYHSIKASDGIPGQVYVVNEDSLTENPDRYRRFLRSVYQAAHELSGMDDEQLWEAIKVIRSQFTLKGVEEKSIAVPDLKGNIALWVENGRDNILKNDDKQWENAKTKLIAQGVIEDSGVDLYTNDVWHSSISRG